ncbi:MAG: hypothetical protein CMG74_09995 [Candidatus Marinimicrobia bacterium]|nr:hypothetical protein [Candidatus Neomarinimicrobiota bacterium]|tara:strand:+ start:11231 stop:12217 length:987 start_codon:yes stop_codon:yes gene_type:complete
MMNKKIIIILVLFFYCCDKTDEIDNLNRIYGCTDSSAVNFDLQANINDGSCEYLGCMDPQSVNYDPVATIDDGNCLNETQIHQGYRLFWNDEFNGDSLNLDYWNVELMHQGAVNDEKQTYVNRPENLSIDNGNLRIRAKKDNPFNPNQPGYTSARINTKEKIQLEHGYVEIRAKLPSGTGTWPAIWMLGGNIDSIGWPQCGEIDIMEHVGHNPDYVFFSIHNGAVSGNVSGTDQQGIYYANNIEGEYHVYALDWDSTYIRGYFDGQLYFEYLKSSSMNFQRWPYDNSYFLILNLAIGGEWGGQNGIDNTIFPTTFFIDYVRMFKKIDD